MCLMRQWHPYTPPKTSKKTVKMIRSFVTGLSFAPDDGDPRRTVAQRHEVVRDVPDSVGLRAPNSCRCGSKELQTRGASSRYGCKSSAI